MRYQSPTQLACGSKEFYPLSRFPQGKAGAGLVPPTAQTTRLPPQEGISKHSVEIPLARSPWPGLTWRTHPIHEALAGLSAGTVTSSGPGDGSIGRF